MKYCLPIIAEDVQEITATIDVHIEEYQYFEVWLDYVTSLDDQFISDISSKLGDRLIILFRRQNLEPIKLPMERRKQIIDTVASSHSYIDLDSSQTEELAYAHSLEKRPALLTSYHNYAETPATEQLEAIIATMEQYAPHIYKLATYCQNQDDALRLLQLLLKLKTSGKHAIVSGMGEQGQMTKVFGALWGNEMTFAPYEAEQASAPGQLTRDQLEAIFKELGQ